MDNDQAKFEGWAVVEVMGHQKHVGHVTTQVFGPACMFRVDHPELPEVEETLEAAEWVGQVYALPGSVVRRPMIPAQSHSFGRAIDLSHHAMRSAYGNDAYSREPIATIDSGEPETAPATVSGN